MTDRERIRISKYLSRHLRHAPADLGLQLEEGGWVGVDLLLGACAGAGFAITRAQLEEVVRRCDKQRFALDPATDRIRASQGHSIPIDLQLEASPPPAILYHGTAVSRLDEILRNGLQRMARHHVHLSATIPAARAVGARHGKPVVLEVDAAAMASAGFPFYCSANGVWLVDTVPPHYLRVP